jgi:hypothetical protein
MASRRRQIELPGIPGRTRAALRSDVMEPVPTEHELHQLAARAAALEEVAIIYRAVHAQRASYPTDSEAYRALSHVLDLLRARRGDSGGQPSEAS